MAIHSGRQDMLYPSLTEALFSSPLSHNLYAARLCPFYLTSALTHSSDAREPGLLLPTRRILSPGSRLRTLARHDAVQRIRTTSKLSNACNQLNLKHPPRLHTHNPSYNQLLAASHKLALGSLYRRRPGEVETYFRIEYSEAGDAC
jgi:hypothetical protein